jgi:3-oxoacyl-(acyl-carrier-protein) synthase/malonyl CoA-acyl carrier protein transacylase/phosphopantetheinyl transferase
VREPVAIVGMGAAFPGAPDLASYWRNLEAGVDAITAIPAARLDPDLAAANGFTCTRGGFLDGAGLVVDPIAFGIMPVAAASAEPDQMLALHVAAAAIADAGGELPRSRTAVILGRGGYLNPGMARLANRVRTGPQLAALLADLELDADTIERIRAAFSAKAGHQTANESAIGLVPNLAASRIANRLDLRGPAYTIDAACASSLLAVDQACRELADHRCDAVVAGGVHVCHDVTFWSVFTQLGALSKSSQIRPFDRRADGIVIGEGCGIVVLKRLSDAERAGDRIYATILGCGVSSDGRESSAMRPRADGQLAAIGDAWKIAQRDPAAIGLVEAHGTATPTGDEVELSALAQFFGAATAERAALGSVKSMIGHAMPAAGAAGLIKAALAAHHGVLPPSLHCEEPNDALAHTRFRVLARAEPWDATDRVAGISAFGFGGINAHVVICNRPSAPSRSRGVTAHKLTKWLPSLSASARSIDDLRAALAGQAVEPGPMRIAMLDPTPERILLANKVLDRGQPWRGKSDIWFAPSGFAAEGGKLAFVFPGVEATFSVDVDDVAAELGITAPEIAVAMAAAKSQAATPRDLELRGSGVFALGRLLATALARAGVEPDAIAGHSLGEWTGMVVSEMIPPAEADVFVGALPENSLEVPDVVFAALGCGAAGANTALEGLDEIAVSHDNCPHQSIICGRHDRVKTAMARLAARGVLCQELPFKSGFHSPLLAEYLGTHRKHLAKLALQRPRVPLWSATTCAPYPDEPAQIRKIVIDHLVEPVRFRELVDAMYADGVRAFVQLGVGSTGSFVEDTLRGKPQLTIAAASAKHTGLSQLARVQCALFAEGFLDRSPQPVAAPNSAPKSAPKSTMILDLGVPLVRLAGVVPPIVASAIRLPAGNDPILAELVATLDEAAAASRAVVDAYRRGKVPTDLTTTRALSVATDPYLHDHCFYRQPPDWPIVSDHYPVVPMTMTIGMLIAAAHKLCPDLVPIAVEEIRALRWLAVEPPVEISMQAKLRTPGLVDVDLPGYSRATVRFAAAYPPAPRTAHAPLTAPRAAPHTAAQMYADRWMFHGPAYQGVTSMGPVGSDGVDGEITTLPAPGALLDCAGQLMGWWVMHTEKRDRLAMPVVIERLELFAPHPGPGERVQCSVRMRDVGEINVRADLELSRDGVVWARITGWTDRRFDSDDEVWAVLQYPEHNALAVEDPAGFVTATEHWRGSASRELMMRRYLTECERADHERIGPRGRRGWLLGRIALKDAVRLHRWRSGEHPLWPSQITVSNAPSGRPLVDGVHVSVAHKDDRAVAIVDAQVDVGIDLERIEPRTAAFLAIAFTPAELVLADGRDAEYARLWAAKEAVAKALGTGMTDPKRFEVRVHGDKLQIGDFVVETKLEGDYAIAWTRTPT